MLVRAREIRDGLPHLKVQMGCLTTGGMSDILCLLLFSASKVEGLGAKKSPGSQT